MNIAFQHVPTNFSIERVSELARDLKCKHSNNETYVLLKEKGNALKINLKVLNDLYIAIKNNSQYSIGLKCNSTPSHFLFGVLLGNNFLE